MVVACHTATVQVFTVKLINGHKKAQLYTSANTLESNFAACCQTCAGDDTDDEDDKHRLHPEHNTARTAPLSVIG